MCVSSSLCPECFASISNGAILFTIAQSKTVVIFYQQTKQYSDKDSSIADSLVYVITRIRAPDAFFAEDLTSSMESSVI